MLILFVVDTSASMNQKTNHAGMTSLDLAKAAIEHFVKNRLRIQHDRYFLITCEEGNSAFKCSGWKDHTPGNPAGVFLQELKNLQAKDMTLTGPCLKKAFEHLNLFRVQYGLDNYGQGRMPWFMEPASIIVVTEGGSLTSMGGGVSDQLTIPVAPYPGSELTLEPFRWDQRVFTVILQVGGVNAATPLQISGIQTQNNLNLNPFIVNHSTYSAMSEVTGGCCQVVTNYKMLIAAMDSLVHRTNALGVVVNFETMLPSPSSNSSSNSSSPLPVEAKHKMLFVRPNVAGFWPLPEGFHLDSNTPSLPPRTAHPTIRFNPVDIDSHIVDNFPFDKYEVEPSLLSNYLIQFKPKAAWQVFMFGSQGGNTKGEPFGFLKANTNKTAVNLFVCPYNYPKLWTLLDELIQFPERKPSPKWKLEFEKYLQSIPHYYYSPMRTAMKRFGAPPNIMADQYENIFSHPLQSYFKKLKQSSKIESDRVMNSLKQARESSQQNSKETNARQLSSTSLSSSDKSSNFHRLLGGSNSNIYSDSLSSFETAEDTLELNEFYSSSTAIATLPTHRNVFDISRNQLLENIQKIREFIQKPNNKIPEEVARHTVPIGEMGNYVAFMNRAEKLRDIHDDEKKKPVLFGNPFRLEKKPNLNAMNFIDEAEDESIEGGNSNKTGKSLKRRQNAGPTPPGSPQQLAQKQKIRKITQQPNAATPQKIVQQIQQTVQQANQQVHSSSTSSSPLSSPVSSPIHSPQQLPPPSENRTLQPSIKVETTNENPPPKSFLTPQAILLHNAKIKSDVIKQVRRPGKVYDEIFKNLRELQGELSQKKEIVLDVIQEANRFKKAILVSQLKSLDFK